MRRRFTLAIVGVVAGALVVAGLGTLLLLTVQGRHDARRDVTDLATRIADEGARAHTANDPVPALRPLSNFLRHTDELTIVRVGPQGRTPDALPGGLTTADLSPPALGRGRSVSGFRGRQAYAAVPFTKSGARLAAVVTRRTSSEGGAALFFLLAGGVALVVAFGVAATLARRITRPLVTVQDASLRIAEGDLTARAPTPRGSYPELSSLTGSVNAMADNLERLRAQERQFLLSVSHDLRTPLTSIRGYAEALADGTATDTTRAAEVIAAEARRLERLVRDLLDLAKLESHRFTLDLRPTDLWEVVGDTAAGFEPAAERLGLQLVAHDRVTSSGEGGTTVTADPDRLAQVVANLVENALKYAARQVDVRIGHHDGLGVITVDDDGPGIAAEDLPHVFERLWTSTRGPARQVGSGIGLAIVAELVGAMGGAVRAESPVPEDPRSRPGTRITVSLPTADHRAGLITEPSSAWPSGVGAEGVDTGPRF